MKKVISSRYSVVSLFFTVVCCLSSMVSIAGDLQHNLGITNYLFTVADHYDVVSQFKLQRYFVDNFRVQKGNLDFWTQPTWQNFKQDDALIKAKANGAFNIWCTQGKLDFQTVQGKANKVNPVNDADDPLQQASWKDYGSLVKQIAIRYADDTAPYLSQARVFRSATYQNNTPKAGLGLVDAIEDRNEWDFKKEWSGALYTMTPEQSAVGFKVFMDSVRSVSKTIKLIMGGTINPQVETFTRFIAKLKSLYAAEGKAMPTDWYLCFHWYMRNGSINQGAGTWGITPEDARAYRFGQQLDSLCTVYGLPGWFCTETGWATYTTGTNIDMGKQNAPVLQGYDIYHAQAICMVRLGLIWGATKYCRGISFWHCRDLYDTGAYAYGGVNYSNWLPKYGQTVLAEYAPYKNYSISNFRQQGELYAVDLTASADSITFVWTNQNRFGEYDAKPRAGFLEMPNQSPVLTVTSPTTSTFTAPASVTLSVNASDNDGNVARVEFYNGSTLLFSDAQPPYTYTASALAAGSYAFRIVAYDNLNLSTSVNVPVTVNEVAPPPTNTTGLTIVNHQLYLNGSPFKIIEANSPETALIYLDYGWLDWLNSKGVNTIYVTMNGKESGKPQVSPWKNNTPSQGFDEVKVNAWVAFLTYWCNLGDGRKVVHILLSEKETHNLFTDQQNKDAMLYLATKLTPINGKMVIDREEVPNGWGRMNSYYDYEKQVFGTNAIRAMHNNTNQNPWSSQYTTGRIQFLSFQEWQGNFNNRIRTEVLKFSTDITGYASEVTGGFQPNDVAKADLLWNAAPGYSAGVGVYMSCCDQRDTHDGWYRAYEPVFVRLKQLADGTGNSGGGGDTPPPTVPALTSVLYKDVSGATIADLQTTTTLAATTAKTTIVVDGNAQTKSVRIVLTGPVVSVTKNENIKPWGVFGDSNGVLAGQVLQRGSYTVTTTPYSNTGQSGTAGQTVTINFVIQ